MKFLKDNSYDIVKLYINQIGITIFSLVLYTAVGFVADDALMLKLKVILSVFAILFYVALIYTAAWDFGAKDKIKIDSGKLESFEPKGAVMAFFANLPNILLALGCVIIAICAASPETSAAFTILNFIMRFAMAMFIGLIQGIFSSAGESKWLLESIAYLVAPLVSILTTQIGYSLGKRNMRIAALFSAKR